MSKSTSANRPDLESANRDYFTKYFELAKQPTSVDQTDLDSVSRAYFTKYFAAADQPASATRNTPGGRDGRDQ